ncbi:SseB family protein [Microbacterium marinilacus]|uniref:SseB protein N-terminal domain-containing protein n=1 Tax=Microbacterium marinilacus TaxID=415209 RepID=A0ABP7BE93_9MICO|nr:SseB family protein [Microbacterium marinilacus]MBY0689351.1 SseB family protein [Microbacterium marinilacus]
MGLFSRKKKNDDQSAAADSAEQTTESGASQAPAEPASDPGAVAEPAVAEPPASAAATEPAAGAAGDAAPQVNISMSSYRGLGADAGPEVAPPSADQDAQGGPASEPAARPAAARPAAPAPRELPLAPAAPPEKLESVPGLRDNALLRDALAALPENPTGAQLLGVVRQLLQGHVFLRVQGNAREQLAEGSARLSFGIARDGDNAYMLVFSSGKALHDAVRADGDASTSAVGQPVGAILKHLVEQDFAGLIVDNNSAPHRAVLPRQVLERALTQADPDMRLKAAIGAPREADTPHRIATLIAEGVQLWIALGKTSGDASPDGEQKLGIAEARLADGTRLLQVYSHPLEIAAQGRDERALPLSAAKLGQVLRDHEGVGGIIIDPAGPLMTLTRDELAPVIALAPEADESDAQV